MLSDQQNLLPEKIFDCFAFVIQARMGSERLPGKIMLKFGDTTVLGHLINSLISSNISEKQIIIATTNNPLDDLTENYASSLGVKVVRGDEKDVFSRYQDVVQHIDYKYFIRLTGDNPLPNIELLAHCAQSHLHHLPDLTSTRYIDENNKVIRYAPKGLSVDILCRENFLKIDTNKLTEFEREHVIPWFYRNGEVNLVKDYTDDHQEVSIDTINDYVRLVLLN